MLIRISHLSDLHIEVRYGKDLKGNTPGVFGHTVVLAIGSLVKGLLDSTSCNLGCGYVLRRVREIEMVRIQGGINYTGLGGVWASLVHDCLVSPCRGNKRRLLCSASVRDAWFSVVGSLQTTAIARNLIRVWGALENVTRIAWDLLGRKVAMGQSKYGALGAPI